MDQYQETFETWNKIAYLYQERFMELDLYNDTYDQFCALLSPARQKVLEIGCGPGNITRYLLTQRPDLQIHGIDVAPNMVQLAKQNNPAATFSVMDCRELDTVQERYDAVLCGFCLPYLSKADCVKFIQDCRQLLRLGGVFYLSFVAGAYESSGFLSGSSGARTYFYYHSAAEIQAELARNSFHLAYAAEKEYPKPDGASETHTILIAQTRPF